jgi:hypothetical protein
VSQQKQCRIQHAASLPEFGATIARRRGKNADLHCVALLLGSSEEVKESGHLAHDGDVRALQTEQRGYGIKSRRAHVRDVFIHEAPLGIPPLLVLNDGLKKKKLLDSHIMGTPKPPDK